MHPNNTTQEIPYGYCKCGCGQKTNVITRSDPKRGYVIGEYYTYLPGHFARHTYRARFWKRANPGPANECWLWLGNTTGTGYGQLSIDGYPKLAHRLSWEMHNGPIPDGLWVLHKCDNHGCVNPNHLFLGTPQDNTQDMIKKGRRARINVKLTEDKVVAIRQRVERGERRCDLAQEFGVSRSTVSDITKRKIWKHI